jgi:hypothetical protein
MPEVKATPTAGGQATADKTTSQQVSSPASSASSKPAGASKPPEQGKAQGPGENLSPKPLVATDVVSGPKAAQSNDPGAVVEVKEDESGAVHPIKRSEGTAGPSQVSGFAGIVGGPFAVYGQNLEGDVLVGGRPVTVTARQRNAVKGEVPADFEPGDVDVKVGDQTFHGKLVR